jgi:hypothetical protein
VPPAKLFKSVFWYSFVYKFGEQILPITPLGVRGKQ